MADVGVETAISQGDALVLLGRRSDLLRLQGQADLPARFLAVYEGGLEATAGDADQADFDRLVRRHRVVGLDAELLAGTEGEDLRTRRYRDNLVQKLAARRVALLTVLGEAEAVARDAVVSFVRRGDSGGITVTCQPERQSIDDWRAAAAEVGLRIDVDLDAASDLACFVVTAADGSPMVAARSRDRDRTGDLVELLAFASEGDPDESRLRSRWFAAAHVRRSDGKMAAVLADCARRRERESLDLVLRSWREALASMQADTRALVQLELIVVATRPIAIDDQQRIAGCRDIARAWVMTDRLRAGGDRRTLVRSCHVWPDAVAALLARLCLDRPEPGARGLFAWRSFVCGIAADASRIEAIRDRETRAILDRAEEAPDGLAIQRKGPFEPLEAKWLVDRADPPAIDWDEGGGGRVVDAACAESAWVADHREAGARLGIERAKLGKALLGDAADPERVYSQHYWTQVHRSPGMLRVFGTERLFRADPATRLHERIPAHLAEWRDDVLGARRALARGREDVRQAAEEFDRARRFHVALPWRILVGSAVASYAGFLALNVLRVLLTFGAAEWSTGITIFAAAVVGGWAGALLPAWVEHGRGRAAAVALTNRMREVVAQHRDAVAETHEVFRDAEGVRQTIRITSVQRRTTLLAERAWSIVSRAREEVAAAYERRKLLGGKAGGVDESERLAAEDRREWRSASVVRPVYEHGRDMPDGAVWSAAFADVATAFRREWQERMEAEDPYCTGFLRVAVLTKLVHDLADLVSARIERELLLQAERNAIAGGGAIGPQAWVERIAGAIGRDADQHAMLSVLDDGSAQRTSGVYRMYRRDTALAADVCRRLAAARPGFASGPMTLVEAMPLGGFAMLFHEVPLAWQGVELVLDESASRDPADGEGAS